MEVSVIKSLWFSKQWYLHQLVDGNHHSGELTKPGRDAVHDYKQSETETEGMKIRSDVTVQIKWIYFDRRWVMHKLDHVISAGVQMQQIISVIHDV